MGRIDELPTASAASTNGAHDSGGHGMSGGGGGDGGKSHSSVVQEGGDDDDNKMSVAVQENISLVQPESTLVVVPGAVMVGPSNDVEDDTHVNESEDVSGLPILAHLAPDVEALMEERLAARVPQVLEERRRQEMIQANNVPLVNDDDVIVAVVDEVKTVPLHEGVKKRSIGMIAIVLVLLIVVGMVVYFLLRDNKVDDTSQEEAQAEDTPKGPTVSQTDAPSFSPLPLDPLVEELKFWIAPTAKDLLPFSDPSSPQSQALAWLQDDPITLSPGRLTRIVLERYVLAVFYYSTSGPSSRYDYLSRDDVCTWNTGIPAIIYRDHFYGISCIGDGESVDGLALMDNNLRGTLPWELALLTNLQFMIFDQNGLTGSIPARIIELTNLDFLSLSYNGLTGSIPAEITELTRLEYFLAVRNALTGPLPSTFSPVTTDVNLEENLLTGSIPESWGTTMPTLDFVTLYGNLLTGTFPTTIGVLSNLGALWLYNNLLTGTIPTELSQLSSLQWLAIEDNSFTGSVEPILCILTLTELTILSADCEEVHCPCCTSCCYDDQLYCDELDLNITTRRIIY